MNSLMGVGVIGLLTCAVGCGSVDTNKLADAPATTDGQTGDGTTAIDAAPTHGTATVHVLDPKGTVADAVGVPVVFIDAGTQTVPTNRIRRRDDDVHTGAQRDVDRGDRDRLPAADDHRDRARRCAHDRRGAGRADAADESFTLIVPLLDQRDLVLTAFEPCGASPTVPGSRADRRIAADERARSHADRDAGLARRRRPRRSLTMRAGVRMPPATSSFLVQDHMGRSGTLSPGGRQPRSPARTTSAPRWSRSYGNLSRRGRHRRPDGPVRAQRVRLRRTSRPRSRRSPAPPRRRRSAPTLTSTDRRSRA